MIDWSIFNWIGQIIRQSAESISYIEVTTYYNYNYTIFFFIPCCVVRLIVTYHITDILPSSGYRRRRWAFFLKKKFPPFTYQPVVIYAIFNIAWFFCPSFQPIPSVGKRSGCLNCPWNPGNPGFSPDLRLETAFYFCDLNHCLVFRRPPFFFKPRIASFDATLNVRVPQPVSPPSWNQSLHINRPSPHRLWPEKGSAPFLRP